MMGHLGDHWLEFVGSQFECRPFGSLECPQNDSEAQVSNPNPRFLIEKQTLKPLIKDLCMPST